MIENGALLEGTVADVFSQKREGAKIMELLQLRYFCTLVEYRNMTRAAEKLMISQPSLSKTLKRLEQEVGTPLFDRVNGRLELNRAGSLFYEGVTDALRRLDSATQGVRELAGDICGAVWLSPQVAINSIPGLYHEFTALYPGIHLDLHMFGGKKDARYTEEFFLFAGSDPTGSDIVLTNKKFMMSEEIVLAVPTGHPLAGREKIDLIEAAEYPFISYISECNIKELTESMCRKAGFEQKIACNADITATHANLIMCGFGISLVAYSSMSEMFDSHIVPVRLKDAVHSRNIYLGWAGDNLSAAGQCFVDFCTQYYYELGKITPPENNG